MWQLLSSTVMLFWMHLECERCGCIPIGHALPLPKAKAMPRMPLPKIRCWTMTQAGAGCRVLHQINVNTPLPQIILGNLAVDTRSHLHCWPCICGPACVFDALLGAGLEWVRHE